jgi:hypothetical protein
LEFLNVFVAILDLAAILNLYAQQFYFFFPTHSIQQVKILSFTFKTNKLTYCNTLWYIWIIIFFRISVEKFKQKTENHKTSGRINAIFNN